MPCVAEDFYSLEKPKLICAGRFLQFVIVDENLKRGFRRAQAGG
jgi:hypothetical protein